MVVAAIALVLGVLSFVGPVPIILPVIGLGMAANAIVRETRKEKDQRRKPVIVVASIAAALGGFVTLMLLLGPFIR